MKKFFSRVFSPGKSLFMDKFQGNLLFWSFLFSLFSVPAFAAPPTDVASLAASVNFADVAGAILAIAGSVIGIYVSWKGAQFVIKQVRGA